jgi:hypothetical protein
MGRHIAVSFRPTVFSRQSTSLQYPQLKRKSINSSHRRLMPNQHKHKPSSFGALARPPAPATCISCLEGSFDGLKPVKQTPNPMHMFLPLCSVSLWCEDKSSRAFPTCFVSPCAQKSLMPRVERAEIPIQSYRSSGKNEIVKSRKEKISVVVR